MLSGDFLKTYLAFNKDDDTPITGVSKNELRLSLDDSPSTIESLTPFAETGEHMGITLLLDISKTMANRQGIIGPDPFTLLVKAAQKFIDAGSPKDSYCIMTFGDEVKVVEPFTTDKAALKEALASIKPTAHNTLLYEGVQKAFDINRQKGGNIPDRRAAIVISDGKDEGSGLTIEDILKNNQATSIPVFAIGFTRIGPEYLTILRRMSSITGGRFFASPTPQKIDQLLLDINGYFNNSYVATHEPPYMNASKAMELKAVYTRDGLAAETTRSVLVPAVSAPVAPKGPAVEEKGIMAWLKRYQWWVAGASLLVLGAIVLFVVLRNRKARAEAAAAEAEAFEAAGDSAGTPSGFEAPLDLTPTSPHAPVHSAAPQQKLRVCGRLEVVSSTISGHSNGSTFPVYERTMIGRTDDCSIKLDDPNISRHHCDIAYSNGVYTLIDFRSTNGTFINGQRVEADTRLRHGDLLRVGQIEFEFSETE
jgi:VWFA-related protein